MKEQNRKNKNTGFIRTTKFSNLVCGFTLVEMMVAIAVFSLIMVAALGALLNIIDANNKARAIKVAINNVSFVVEGISKDMRMGTDYGCATDVEPTVPTSDSPAGGACLGGNIIKYRSPRAFLDPTTNKNNFVYYRFEGTQMWECLEKEGINCSVGTGTYNPLTSSEVTITNAKFYVYNVASKQSMMSMVISGKAGNKEKLITYFDLQTSIAQRIRVKTTEEITI